MDLGLNKQRVTEGEEKPQQEGTMRRKGGGKRRGGREGRGGERALHSWRTDLL